jgi:hypothetical protein
MTTRPWRCEPRRHVQVVDTQVLVAREPSSLRAVVSHGLQVFYFLVGIGSQSRGGFGLLPSEGLHVICYWQVVRCATLDPSGVCGPRNVWS